MKIQCDVCDRDEASVYCVADEAALCDGCDRRVHHANKLAGKHQRFSLLHPSPKQVPVCDICKEKRAFLFCQQDRAILCTDCDGSIHKANGRTQMHTRYLLTGLRVSATSSTYPSSTDSATKNIPESLSSTNSKGVVSPTNSATSKDAVSPHIYDKSNGNLAISSVSSSLCGSSISDYLMEMLPGWHFEDFLDSSNVFSKEGDNEMVLPLMDADLESNLSAFPAGKTRSWVPQVPPPPPLNQAQNPSYQYMQLLAFGETTGTKEHQSKGLIVSDMKSSRKWSDDSCCVVPEMTRTLTASKRQRSFC